MVKNNYSSGRNDDRIANPNGKNEPQEFVEEGQEGVLQKDVMPCHSYSAVGNMNMNSMLVENIRSHDYFKGLSELKTFEEVVDQIYYDCKLISLWHPGTHKTQRAAGMCSGLRGVSNAGVPSTAAMLLFKLYTLQLTTAQVKTLINHQDSVYIKAIGFMYLRHVCDPKQLWGWLKPYVGNNEKFSELDDGSQTTLGSFLKKILLEQEFYDCVLPRLPVPVLREMQKEIDGAGGGGGGGGSDARWEGRRDSRDERPAREERREERPSSSYRDLDQAPGGRDYDRREREDYRRDERRYDEREREGRGGGYDGGRRDDYRGGYERYDERERQQASYARPSHGDGRYGGDAPRAESRPAYPDNSTGRSAGYGDRPASYGESRPTSYERPSSYGDERRDRRDEAELQAKRARTDGPPAPKAETAAEKLARLRAKQASLGGTGHFGRVGADYAGSSNSTAPAKGIQRYQQMMKDGRA